MNINWALITIYNHYYYRDPIMKLLSGGSPHNGMQMSE